MRSFEDQMVALAASKGRHLDLHGVGYAPLPQSYLLSTERVTPGGLSNVLVANEQLATSALASNNSADLLFLRDNLSRLREDVNDGNVDRQSCPLRHGSAGSGSWHPMLEEPGERR